MKLALVVVPAFMAWASAAAQTQVAHLSTCRLELGGTLEDCRIAYRTFGTLAADRGNAILIPTWFASRAETWLPLLGPQGVVDTVGFHVIVVESLGAGSSSSPANTTSRNGAAFPELTIGDMVESSYRLAREHLQLPGLHAVVGISLGGLQAFEWGVSHPEYARRIVPIAGGPHQAIYGRAFWEVLARTLEQGLRGVVPRDSTAFTLARLLVIGASSPAAANERPSSSYTTDLGEQARQFRQVNLAEWAWHARAILRHDISRRFGGDLGRAARAWKSKALVVTSTHDHSIDPQPAQAFARLIGADTLVLQGPAGHGAIFGDSVAKAVIRQFLRR